jgi:hypothetical protein
MRCCKHKKALDAHALLRACCAKATPTTSTTPCLSISAAQRSFQSEQCGGRAGAAPGERELRERAAELLGDGAQRVHLVQVGLHASTVLSCMHPPFSAATLHAFTTLSPAALHALRTLTAAGLHALTTLTAAALHASRTLAAAANKLDPDYMAVPGMGDIYQQQLERPCVGMPASPPNFHQG